MKNSNERLSRVISVAADELGGVYDSVFKDGWIPINDTAKMLFTEKYKLKGGTPEELYAENFDTIILPELIRESELLSAPYVIMLDEAISAYRQGYYAICVASLFCIVEALLTYFARDGDLSGVKYVAPMRVKFARGDYSYTEVLPKVPHIIEAVELFYKRVNFMSLDKNDFLNRHASVHGKADRDFERADALKLFCLIATIKSCYNN